MATATTLRDKVKKNPIETAKTDDFDELVDMFAKSNSICSFKGCKVLVVTLGENCDYCRHRFCLKHSLAEVYIYTIITYSTHFDSRILKDLELRKKMK